MSPLRIFRQITDALAQRPFEFWAADKQSSAIIDIRGAIEKLQSALSAKGLEEGLAYRQLVILHSAVEENHIDEVLLVQTLRSLLPMYRLSPLPPETTKLLDEAATSVNLAEASVLEYHLALETLQKKAEGMSEDERKKADLTMLNEMGMFYVLEYTLQMQYECSKRSDDERRKLIFEGLVVPAGNLPSLASQAGTLKRELCYGIMDAGLRKNLFQLFFSFEDALRKKDMTSILVGLHTFNVGLIGLLRQNGIEMFQGRLLTPYGNAISMEKLLQELHK